MKENNLISNKDLEKRMQRIQQLAILEMTNKMIKEYTNFIDRRESKKLQKNPFWKYNIKKVKIKSKNPFIIGDALNLLIKWCEDVNAIIDLKDFYMLKKLTLAPQMKYRPYVKGRYIFGEIHLFTNSGILVELKHDKEEQEVLKDSLYHEYGHRLSRYFETHHAISYKFLVSELLNDSKELFSYKSILEEKTYLSMTGDDFEEINKRFNYVSNNGEIFSRAFAEYVNYKIYEIEPVEFALKNMSAFEYFLGVAKQRDDLSL